MITYRINPKRFYVNDSVHWFGPFNSRRELDLFFEDSQEEQWFAAIRNRVVIELLNAIKDNKEKT